MNVRIAIDGSFLQLPPSGTGTYLRELLAAFDRLDAPPAIDLLSPAWSDLPVTGRGPASLVRRAREERRLRRAEWELLGVGRAARRVKPDLLHIPHFSAPVRPGAALIVTIHDVISLVWPQYQSSRAMRLHLRLVTRTSRAARLILTPSRAAAADISRVLGIPNDRIRVTPEAASAAHRPASILAALAATRHRFGVTGRYVFNVGGLDIRKNVPALIEAFANVRATLDEPLQLVIAGAAHSANPVVFPPLEPVIQRTGAGGAVILTGRISEADKIALYQGAALYVSPSLHEGFGLTALEAMACGIPTIAANRTSLPEVVGDAGLLVEPNVEAIAAAMTSLLTDPAAAAALGRRGRARAAEFSWDQTARLTRDAYQEAVAMDRGGERTRRWPRSA